MNKSEKRHFKWKELVRLVLLIVCGAILGLNVYFANAGGLVGDKLPMPFGYGAAVILSGSMEPEMSKGDLVLVAETDSVAIGDVVVYQDGSTLILHRIIELDGDTVVTQGDANETADDPISLESVKGKVVFLLPYAGNIVNFLKTPIGIICIIAAAIALLEIPRINEKKKDDEERRQIIEEINRLKDEK